MNETRERPELGTTEAAVRSCVNLIALATHTDEEHLAYWLDCYYQLRVAHEGLIKRRPLALEDLRISPVAADLAQAYAEAFGGPSTTPAPTEKIADGLPGGGPEGNKTWAEFREETVEAPQPAARQMPHDVEAEESERPEAAAAQKKTGLR